MAAWVWLNLPLAAAFFATWVGVPLWLVTRRPETRAPAAAGARAARAGAWRGTEAPARGLSAGQSRPREHLAGWRAPAAGTRLTGPPAVSDLAAGLRLPGPGTPVNRRPAGVRRACKDRERETEAGHRLPVTRMTSRVRGPCTPSTRLSSMSLVADGPLIQVSGRPAEAGRRSRSTASGTSSTTCPARTTHRW